MRIVVQQLNTVIRRILNLQLFALKQSLKETHRFAPSFNLRRANLKHANLRCASGDPPSCNYVREKE